MDIRKEIKEANLTEDQKKAMEKTLQLMSFLCTNSKNQTDDSGEATEVFVNVLRNFLPGNSEASSSKSPMKQVTLDKWFAKNKSPQVSNSPDETINSTTQEFEKVEDKGIKEPNPYVICKSLQTSQTKSANLGNSTSKIIDTVKHKDALSESSKRKVLSDKEICEKNGLKETMVILKKVDSEINGFGNESISKCPKNAEENPKASNTTIDAIPSSPKLVPQSVTEKGYKKFETTKPASKKLRTTMGVNKIINKANVNSGATEQGDEKPIIVEKLTKKSKPTKKSNKKMNLKVNELSKTNDNSVMGSENIEVTDKLLIVSKPVSKKIKSKPVTEHSKLKIETDAVSVVLSAESDSQKTQVFNKISESKETDKLLVVDKSKVKKNKKPLQSAKLVMSHSKLMAANGLEISEIEPVLDILPDKALASIKLSQMIENSNDASRTLKKIDKSLLATKSTSMKCKKSPRSSRLVSVHSKNIDGAASEITEMDGVLAAEHQNDETLSIELSQINENSSAASRTIEKIGKSVNKSTSKKSKKSCQGSKLVTEHSKNIDVAQSEITVMDGEHQNDETLSLNELSQINEKSSAASRTIEKIDESVTKSTLTEKEKKYEAFCKLNETLKTLGIKSEDIFKNKKTTKYLKSGHKTDNVIFIQGHKFKNGLTKHSAYSASKAELEEILNK